MEEDEFYHYSIADAAEKRRDLLPDELKWAKKLDELKYYKNCHWDENGKVI